MNKRVNVYTCDHAGLPPTLPAHTPRPQTTSQDLEKLMKHKTKTVVGLTGGIEGLLKKYKVYSL